MAVAMYMHFPQTTREQYDGVMKELNLKDRMPSGLIYHVAGPADGGMCVMDIWESQADFDRFLKERLQSAMQKNSIRPAAQQTTFKVHNTLMATAAVRH